MRIFETIFDVVYLVTVVAMGIRMLARGRAGRLFGAMAVVLGCGDAFHLVARVWAMWTAGMEANAAALGLGQLVTSVTMTVFYVLLYYVWRQANAVRGGKGLTAVVYLLAAVRAALCLFPQNAWTSPDAPVSWGILRNVPFAALGALLIVLFARRPGRGEFRFMALAVTLSFAFYIPVVLFAKVFPPVGALMMPKTCAYVWIVWMGWRYTKDAGGAGKRA